LRVRAGADAEKHIRRRQPKLLEENVGHVGVVVLTGVQQRLPHARLRPQRPRAALRASDP